MVVGHHVDISMNVSGSVDIVSQTCLSKLKKNNQKQTNFVQIYILSLKNFKTFIFWLTSSENSHFIRAEIIIIDDATTCAPKPLKLEENLPYLFGSCFFLNYSSIFL
jgi:hypothetical protein